MSKVSGETLREAITGTARVEGVCAPGCCGGMAA